MSALGAESQEGDLPIFVKKNVDVTCLSLRNIPKGYCYCAKQACSGVFVIDQAPKYADVTKYHNNSIPRYRDLTF
jgi:hypothetical protein